MAFSAASADAAALLAARYGEAGHPDHLILNDTIVRLLDHRTARAFTDEPLAPGTLETLVAAAQSASSSSNLQPFSVVSVESPQTRARLSEFAGGQKHVARAPLVLVFVADLYRLRTLGQRAQAPTEGLDYLESLIMGCVDAALSAQNAVVAAESLGLGCCYIGGLRNNAEAVAKILNLPPETFAVFGLCVGHPDPAFPAAVKPRLSQRMVLHREAYDPALPQDSVAVYEDALSAFQAREGMGVVGWTKTALQRVRDGASLNGRDRLRGILTTLGFGLK